MDLSRQLNDPARVEEQYASIDRLQTRASVWRPSQSPDPIDRVEELITTAAPHDLLEIGCGTGLLAQRLTAAFPDVTYVATDASPAMVEQTRTRAVTALVMAAEDLSFEDDSFDVVIAGWMLYHVADLDRTMSQVRRVLRPGGTFLALTNGDEHLAELLLAAGGARTVTQFSRENGAASLARHFDQVTREDLSSIAHFADHAAATAYLATIHVELAARLPVFDGPREYVGCPTLFVAR